MNETMCECCIAQVMTAEDEYSWADEIDYEIETETHAVNIPVWEEDYEQTN